jgi:phosphoribosylamine--glycine ligase
LVFHGLTTLPDGRLTTAWGRDLTIIGRGPTVESARARAYRAVERIRFDGMRYRRDIGAAPGPGSHPRVQQVACP